MSVNPNQTNITPSDALFLPASTVIPTILAGVTAISTTTQLVTVGVQGLLSSSTVVPCYIHPSAGGASAQGFNLVTPGTNQVIFDLIQATNSGESISWIAKA
jgi:hypothetical protein